MVSVHHHQGLSTKYTSEPEFPTESGNLWCWSHLAEAYDVNCKVSKVLNQSHEHLYFMKYECVLGSVLKDSQTPHILFLASNVP